MFQIPGLCDIRNTIKDTPIHHLLVGSLEDMVVPDAFCMDSWCPWGFLLQISSVCDIRNTIKDTPIHHLLVGSLVDMVVPDAYCMDIWCPWHILTPQMNKINPLCHQYWCFILCRDTWLIIYTACPRYLYPPGGWVGGWVGLAPWAGKTAVGNHFFIEAFPKLCVK